MMVNLMRTNSRWLMIIITVLVIVSFLWFFSDRTSIEQMGSDRAGSIYGHTVTATELQRVQRRLEVASRLGATDLFRAATGDGYDEAQALVNYFVLEHEADQLGIRPTPEEIRTAGEQLKVFKGANGQYDPAKYEEFINQHLNWQGLGANQIDEIVRMNLMAAKLRSVVTSPVVVSPQEVRTRFDEYYSKTEASVIRLKSADLPAAAEPNEEEITKYFSDQKGQFKQPERRKVQYVKFGLDEAQAKLQGKARMDVLKPLADRAVAFLEKLIDQKGKGDYAALAASNQLTVKETPDFEEDQTTGFEEANVPEFTHSAFKLTKENPDSDVPLQTADAFYNLHLSGITPERPLTLDEARPKIVTAIKAERARAALAARAEEVRTKVLEGIKAGRSFAEASKEAGQTAEDIPPFSLGELDRTMTGAQEIASVTQGLAIGELSSFIPGSDGGTLVYVRGRVNADESKYEALKSAFTAQHQMQKNQIYFFEWIRTNRDKANARLNMRDEG